MAAHERLPNQDHNTHRYTQHKNEIEHQRLSSEAATVPTSTGARRRRGRAAARSGQSAILAPMTMTCDLDRGDHPFIGGLEHRA